MTINYKDCWLPAVIFFGILIVFVTPSFLHGYVSLKDTTHFQIKDHLIDRRWNIEDTFYQNFPKCADKSITYYIKSHYNKGYLRRQKTRNTWGRNKSVVFISFSKDSTHVPLDFNSPDLLLSNSYPETVDLLAIKIAVAIHHASQCNSHAAFTDDDVFFFTDKFEPMVNKNWDLKTTVALAVRGKVKAYEPVVRDRNSLWGKYYQTVKEYPFDTFPAYANGAGYVVSKLAIDKIFKTVPYTRLLRHLDDVYFGLLCRDAGVKAEFDDNFTSAVEPFTGDKTYPCGLYNLHGFRFDKIKDFIVLRYDQCKNGGRFRVNDWENMIDSDNSMTGKDKEIGTIFG